MSAITLACLDMAGTTVTDDHTVEQAFVSAMEAMGVADGTERMSAAVGYVRASMGQSKITVFRHLFEGDEIAARQANDEFERAYNAFVRSGALHPIAGAREAISELRAAGIKVCLTTGFSPMTRDSILAALGWEHAVDWAVSPMDAGRGRPFPDMILAAVLRLGIDDVRSVAVAGDTASDLLAGTRAGATIVAGVLTGAHDRSALEAAPHTHILQSISELPALCR